MITFSYIRNFFVAAFFVVASSVLPVITFAGGLIPCDGTDANKCDFNKLVSLVQSIMSFFLTTAPFVAAALFAYGGFLYFTAQGEPGKIKKATSVFTSALIGLGLILAAWLIIYTVMKGLGVTDDKYWFLAH